MAQGQTTPERTLSNPLAGKGFFEAQQYKAAIERAEGGYHSCELTIDIFKRLQKITEQYSAALREWSTTSQKQVGESRECGTTKKVLLESVRIVEKLAEHNDVVATGIQEKVVDQMISFKNNNYGKSFIHVKKIKEFDHDFKKVQKPWLELIQKTNEMKQTFHDAKRKLRQAEGADKMIQSDVGSTDDQKKKSKTSVEKRKSDTDMYETKYQRLIEECEKKKETYQKDMLAILDRTDEFEKNRLEHFNLIFNTLRDVTLVENKERNDKLIVRFNESIKQHDLKSDIDFFHTYYGRKTETKWPVFENIKE